MAGFTPYPVGIDLDRVRLPGAQTTGMVPHPVQSTRGSKGNAVRDDPNGSPNAAAAPATVSGERPARCHWGKIPGKAARMLRPASQ